METASDQHTSKLQMHNCRIVRHEVACMVIISHSNMHAVLKCSTSQVYLATYINANDISLTGRAYYSEKAATAPHPYIQREIQIQNKQDRCMQC